MAIRSFLPCNLFLREYNGGRHRTVAHRTVPCLPVYYYITNLQGDVLFIVDADGNTVAAYTYDPYGKVLTATGTLANTNPLRHRGYYYDTESGLY